jgi:hypothetical protein
MVDSFAIAIRVDRLGGNKMDHRLPIEVEPISWEVERWAVARLEIEQVFKELLRAFQVGGTERDVV